MKKGKAYPQQKWSLEDLYTGHKNADYQNAIQKLKDVTAEIVKFREKLKPDMDIRTFHKLLRLLEEQTELGARLSIYAYLAFSADTQNNELMALIGQIDAIVTDTSNETLFCSLWWKSLTDEEAEKFIQKSPGYQYFLTQIRNTKPFTLNESSEQIINLKNITGANALDNLYSSITNRYQFTLTVDGKKQKLTRGELGQYFHDARPEVRKKAYQELYRVYAQDGNILGQIYQNIARDWYAENVKVRKYASPIAVRNTVNDIPDVVVDLLLETCQKNKTVFQRYFNVKKKLLNLKTFTRYDLYAPMKKSDKKIAFADAFDMVRAALTEFDPAFTAMAERVFEQNHIDSEVRQGKRSGAFCYTVSPSLTPWVMVNYQGNMSDVSTMAHELGHAIHSMSAEKHNIFEQGSCLPLAETASTFSEMLLTDYMLSREKDPEVRRDIIMQQMDDNYATIQRQAYFALFEKTAHAMIQNGANVDDLNAAYFDNLKDEFGKDIQVKDEFKWEWVCIPHIFSVPFYVYAYSFGQLLVLSLYQKYKQEGRSFIPQYKQLLAAGGSESPENLLKKAGFDFYDPAFWQGGFDVLAKNVSEIERDL